MVQKPASMTINWRDIGTGPHDSSQVWGFGGNLHKRTIYLIRWFEEESMWVDEWTDNADVTHWAPFDEINMPAEP